MAAFTSFDWFLVVVVALSTVAAFFRGFLKVLFSIGGLILGVVLASWEYPLLAARLTLLPSLAARQICAFLLILIAIMVAFTFVAGLLRKLVSVAGLGLFDRILGGLFGFGRGVLLGVAALMAFTAFAPQWEPLKTSRLAPYFLGGAHAVSFIVPADFAQQVAAGATHLLQKSPELFAPHTIRQSTQQQSGRGYE